MPSRSHQQPLRPKHNRPNAPVNEGLAARNRGQKHVDSWRFARNLTIKNPNRITTAVGKATNTYILFDGKFEFLLWGSPENAARAKLDLKTNVLQENPTFQHHREIVGPPRDAQFEAMGSFVWPSDEYSPDKELGQRNFDRLDGIRRENNCFIEYDVSKSSFIVKGGVEDVQEALLRIKGLLCKAVAQSSPVQRLYLIQNECDQVTLQDHALPVVYKSSKPHKTRMGKAVKSVGARLKKEDLPLNACKMKDRVMQTLNKVHWHRGQVEFKVHLGRLDLLQYQPFESMGLPAYREMIADSYNFQAVVTEELGDKVLEERLLSRFLKATDSLEPSERFLRDLADIKPKYTACIEVDLKDGRGNLLITKDWTEHGGCFGPSKPVYKRMDEKLSRTVFLEVYMSDMLTDLTWLLDITALGVQDDSRLPQSILEHGVHYVNMNIDKARALESFCDFESWEGKPKPLAHKRSIKEKIVWKFDMKAPYIGYEVEVAKVFNKSYMPEDIGGRESGTSYEERWTVDVKHRAWEIQLSENAELGIGKGAEWKADIQSWFPVDSDDRKEKLQGHVELLRALQRVQDIVLGKSH